MYLAMAIGLCFLGYKLYQSLPDLTETASDCTTPVARNLQNVRNGEQVVNEHLVSEMNSPEYIEKIAASVSPVKTKILSELKCNTPPRNNQKFS
jgi:hypothetical protein